MASVIFGVGTIISVVLAAKVIDEHLGGVTVFMLVLAFGAMLLFVGFKGTFGIAHIAFLLWGVSFGALVTIFQTAVTRQVAVGKDVATSLQSSTFNFGIVFGSAIGGAILDKFSVLEIIYVAGVLLIVPIILSVVSKKTFWEHTTEEGATKINPAGQAGVQERFNN